MMRAIRSRRPPGRAGAAYVRLALAGAALLAVLARPAGSARADEIPKAPPLERLPAACAPYWSAPGGVRSVPAWNQLLSFAACIQDASVVRVERADQLPGLVEQLHEALAPSVDLYVGAVEHGPGAVKIRGAYQLGMAYLGMLTRARASIAAPADLEGAAADAHRRELHALLEPLLEQPARLVWILFTAIDRAVAGDPTLAPDAVTRSVVRSAREQAELLGRRWAVPPRESGVEIANQKDR